MAYQILPKNCNGCTACANICPTDAITGLNKQIHHIDPERCISCGACGKVCRFEAIIDCEENLCSLLSKKIWKIPSWDQTQCTSCNICLYACPVNAIEQNLYQNTNHFNYLLNVKRCIGCGFCCQACPIDVIVMKPKI
jgi:formate hydrogenlyase subunit 6/NADH:ubiquinone oxidoreductase subunit I